MIEDKSWAKDLDPKMFEIEFVRRHPYADTIPNQDEWLARVPMEARSIEPVPREKLLPENPTPMDGKDGIRAIEKDGIIKHPDGTWECICKTYRNKHKIGVISHRKKCEIYLSRKDG